MKSPTPRWARAAACRGATSAWFPEKGDNHAVARAKRVCREECPVVAQCFLHALEIEAKIGIWAGLAEKDLREVRTAMSLGSERARDRYERTASADAALEAERVGGADDEATA